jgi:uncharacterized protein (DUF1778 family)
MCEAGGIELERRINLLSRATADVLVALSNPAKNDPYQRGVFAAKLSHLDQ